MVIELSKRPSLASVLAAAAAAWLGLWSLGGAQQAPPALAIDGSRFTVDGTPRFLVLVSYSIKECSASATLERPSISFSGDACCTLPGPPTVDEPEAETFASTFKALADPTRSRILS